MLPLSIVILTKNESAQIGRCLNALKGLSDDILVIDSGSTDNTVHLASEAGAHVINVEWKGYSATKNFGNEQAANDWILSLDADEEMNDTLRNSIQAIFSKPLNFNTAYSIQRKMMIGEKVLRHGSVSNEFRTRLFNRKTARWNDNEVHEDIEFSSEVNVLKLDGFVWHYSFKDHADHLERLEKYAQLSASQLYKNGKQISWIKLYLSPLFNFIKNYFFKAGFLDGNAGYDFAKNEMWYVHRKYKLLKQYATGSVWKIRNFEE